MPISEDIWRQTLIPATATLAEVIRNLVDSGLQIALAVSPEIVLEGTVTDGDIRRGLLRGLTMDDSIETIIHRQPLVVTPQLDRDQIITLMRANRINQVPVVDEAWRVLGLHTLHTLDQSTERDHVMVIMAGGMGKRLRPHTENCPKPLLPVAGKPMLEHIIERAKLEGFSRFVLAIHYLGHMIEEHFGNGQRMGVQIDYLHEQAPMGTAGALGLLSPRPDAPIVVTNGDVITDIRYSELLDFHLRHKAVATMAVRWHEWQHPFGVVQIEGINIIGFEEKPIVRSHINAGVYAIDQSALQIISANEYCDMPTLFERLQLKGQKTVAYPMHEPWLDVGRPGDLAAAQAQSSCDVS